MIDQHGPLVDGQFVGDPDNRYVKGLLPTSITRTYLSQIIHQNLEKLERKRRKRSRTLVQERNKVPSVPAPKSKDFSMEFITSYVIVQFYSTPHAQYLSSTDTYFALHLLVMVSLRSLVVLAALSKVLFMGVKFTTSNEKEADVAHIWYTQWKENRGTNATPITWECFSETFLDRFFPRELREVKAQEFMNLRQGSMTVQEYGCKFKQLSRYAPHMVVDSKPLMNKFMYGVSDLVKTECRNAMLLEDMNSSRLMNHAQ
ncbi:hypothetical protein KY284_000793 [Solanum tuberosum]|nr:hypothetical protein KY284_000793 [Solanum tuberosum]